MVHWFIVANDVFSNIQNIYNNIYNNNIRKHFMHFSKF